MQFRSSKGNTIVADKPTYEQLMNGQDTDG